MPPASTAVLSDNRINGQRFKSRQALATPTGIPVRELNNLSLRDEPVAQNENYEYADFLPSYPEVTWKPLEEIDVGTDAAIGADPEYRKLFAFATNVEHLTPKLGTVLHGVQLDQLDEDQKRELALLTAYRGVVFFKNQEHFDVEKQLELGKFFGPLHRHATTAIPQGWDPIQNGGFRQDWDAVHVVHADVNKTQSTGYPTAYYWHTDVSYEKQPPSYTTLKLLGGPPAENGGGGDTLWVSGYGLYDLLSSGLREYLENLKATHSAVEQAEDARRSGRHVRREPIVSEHPVIRTHPVTGYKALYVNPGFTRKLVGVSGGESQAILKHLFELIASSPEITVRYKWSKNDVALWDNRIVNHTASYAFFPHGRHAIRVTPHGEKPYFDKQGISQQEAIDEYYGESSSDLDGSKGGSYND